MFYLKNVSIYVVNIIINKYASIFVTKKTKLIINVFFLFFFAKRNLTNKEILIKLHLFLRILWVRYKFKLLKITYLFYVQFFQLSN